MNTLIKKKFYFVRHGKTDWNKQNLCQGQIDIPLNQSGIEEIEQLSSLLITLPFSKIFTSPLLRALQSAQIIQKYCSLPIEVIDALKERGWGSMEGSTSADMYQIEELEEKDASYVSHFGIEPRLAFKQRVLYGINSALNQETPLIVSHGRVFLILLEILNLPFIRQISNATIIECNPFDDKWQITFHSTKKIEK
ncbi:MAG: histidine phosphatase family protein [Candidatus Rhabdochlamydia sp.]